MNRLIQRLIAGSLIVAAAGFMMRRNPRRNMLNRFYNTMINMMGRTGAFRLFGRTRIFKRMVNFR